MGSCRRLRLTLNTLIAVKLGLIAGSAPLHSTNRLFYDIHAPLKFKAARIPGIWGRRKTRSRNGDI